MELIVGNIPEMYCEMMLLMNMRGIRENSRNGEVLSLPEPLMVRVLTPTVRVLHDSTRLANPFFHVMEFVWMMTGSNRVDWISQFNKRFVEYADPPAEGMVGYNRIHGAYGHRWLHHFHTDQIRIAINMLKADPESRRVVLGMWDPKCDLGTAHNDLPCNTHIYLRIQPDALGIHVLHMTVCNRSNDVIWGMTGANAVHMTLLQELIANAIGIPVGTYTLFTNNAHIYTALPGVQDMLSTRYATYPDDISPHLPLLAFGENEHDFLDQCQDLVDGVHNVSNVWLNTVAKPMRDIYLIRKAGGSLYKDILSDIADKDWQVACKEWLQWKAQ